jgi:hypothetical protein
MEYIRKLDLIKEGKERIYIDGMTGAVAWMANAIEAEMQKEVDHLLKKVATRDKIIHQMKEYDRGISND